MHITFDNLQIGSEYSRQELAKFWGCRSFHALARGVVTPKSEKMIILFVTEEKQCGSEHYEDQLVGKTLQWEGPNDHFAEDRMLNASEDRDEIHLFHRKRHHSDFVYLGRVYVVDCQRLSDCPSRFVLACME